MLVDRKTNSLFARRTILRVGAEEAEPSSAEVLEGAAEERHDWQPGRL